MAKPLLYMILASPVICGCALTPEQQAALNREPGSPNDVYLIERAMDTNGITCRYSNGSVIERLNIASRCP